MTFLQNYPLYLFSARIWIGPGKLNLGRSSGAPSRHEHELPLSSGHENGHPDERALHVVAAEADASEEQPHAAVMPLCVARGDDAGEGSWLSWLVCLFF